jgi:hypothetical protein
VAAISGLEDQVNDWCHGIACALRLHDPARQRLMSAAANPSSSQVSFSHVSENHIFPGSTRG